MNLLLYSFLLAVAYAQSCPEWVVPWGKYRATLNKNVCTYANIRFASPPVGKLRFQKPEYPPKSNPAPPGSNPVCFQAKEVACVAAQGFPDAEDCYGDYFGTQSEDCLFLDVDVPLAVFKMAQPVPVAVWFYGGAYLYGSKTFYKPDYLPFYNGDVLVDGALKANKQKTSLIFVRGNYRLGAFGWLAGSYMEKNGQPNAGLLDQRAMLQFVRDHIAKVNGDPNMVSVWGESAGASSIMHHLVAPLSIEKPLFNRAVLQSPAYQWLWDRKGILNATYTQFARKAGCKYGDMTCLQNVDSSALEKANQDLMQSKACEGIMPIGPSVDGALVPSLGPNAFTAQKMMSLDSIISSHVNLEVPYASGEGGSSFLPLEVRKNPKSETNFQTFLGQVFPGDSYKDVRKKVSIRYPVSEYKDQIARTVDVITDSSFICNNRYIMDAYSQSTNTRVYHMNYAMFSKFKAATHASDLLPLFSDPSLSYEKLLKCVAKKGSVIGAGAAALIQEWAAPGIQKRFTDHAIWGDPNKNIGEGYPWHRAVYTKCPSKEMGTCYNNLLKVSEGFGPERTFSDNKGPDEQTSSSTCDFWSDLAAEIGQISALEEHKESENGHPFSRLKDQITMVWEA